MNKLQACGMLAAFAIAGAVMAQTPTKPDPTRPDPAPATSPAEGTAADKTPPGRTPTRPQTADPQQASPSTSEAEGTAADTTPPGATRKETGRTPGGATTDLVGAQVVNSSDKPIGSVVDVVFNATGQPDFVVISMKGNQATAVPYATASSMMSGDKVVMDESKLQRAPKVKQGEWRSKADTRWKNDSSRYWDQG